MKKKPIEIPKFTNESAEADWWASRQGREFVKRNAAVAAGKSAPRGSNLVRRLSPSRSIQIAIRLPEPDVARARELAIRKGIGYQTLLKILVHEGLRREARRVS